jgi:hypothetical protein
VRVRLTEWEWQCCGEDFRVGSEVDWDVMPLQPYRPGSAVREPDTLTLAERMRRAEGRRAAPADPGPEAGEPDEAEEKRIARLLRGQPLADRSARAG